MTRIVSRLLAALSFVLLAAAPALAQNYNVPAHAIPLGRGTNVSAFNSIAPAANSKFIVGGGTSADFVAATMSGDCTLAAGVVTCGKLNGVTAPSSGTSGGIVYYSSTSAMASSGALTANALVLGGGAGSAPTPMGSLGTTSTLLHGNASGAPTFGSVVSADMNITTTSCTNQFVTAISAGGVGTCTTDTLAGAQHANQGTTTTVLHGNASGNPSWGSVNFATDGTGIVPAANGGAGTISGALKANGSGTVSQAAASDLSNGTTGSGSVVLAAGPALTGTVDVQQAIALSGDISPTQITSNQNDYAPSGFSTASTMRLDIDADRSITGLAGGSDGRLIVIHNISTHSLTLTNQDTGSTAANRFLLGGDVALAPDTSITLRYDATSSRWRAIASAGSGGGGGGSGTVTSAAIAAGVGVATSGTCTITTSGTCTVSLADQYRQNDLLMCANQAKALAGYQRILETFCDGYKASDGVASVTSGAVNTTSGYVGPTAGGNDSNTKLLLHFDGSNGATTTTDSSTSGRTVTIDGTATLSTSQQEFGTASLSTSGSTGNRARVADNTDLAFGTGDFTLDLWVRFTSTLTNDSVTKSIWEPVTQSSTRGQLTVFNQVLGWSVSGTNIATSSALTWTGGVWYHVAVVRSGTALTIYRNGVSVATATDSRSYVAGSDWMIGNSVAGFIDEVRLSNIARWTTTFTPPTVAYSSGSQNMTLVTTTQTADATVSNGRVLMEIDPIDSITLNTDLTVEITCNGGTNYASATLSSIGKGQAGRTVVESADTACTSGTTFAARIKNLNNKTVNVYKTTVTVH